MQDRVADVLRQRAALDRGAGLAVAVSILLHGGIGAVLVYAALHAPPPQTVSMVNIQFARAAASAPAMTKPAKPKKVEPKIEEPKPVAVKEPPKPEKNTVPFSPFGQSTKKGSETPPVKKPEAKPAPGAPAAGTTAEVPVGGSGVTGLEGGDFPYTLYIDGMQRKIGNNWFRPQVAGGAATVIYFRILRDGTIVEAKIETPSGNTTFDRAALSAVRSANPLNPLPFAYNGNFLGVHLTFR